MHVKCDLIMLTLGAWGMVPLCVGLPWGWSWQAGLSGNAANTALLTTLLVWWQNTQLQMPTLCQSVALSCSLD